jgi:phage FluMu gp28-like protein
LRWARQSGKSWILAALIIWFCSVYPNRLALIVAPGLRQSMILSDKIHDLLGRIPKEKRRNIILQQLRTIVRFRNGSQIVALPNSEHLLRGYTAHLIVVDEAAFFHNDETIFMNVLTPMMATTDGSMIVSSTPWGKKTVFYQLNQDPGWNKCWVSWEDAVKEGRYSPDFVKDLMKIREQRPQVFKMEYEAEFIEDVDTWLSQDLLAKVCEDIEYIPFDAYPKGQFFVGVDLAEKVDYSAIAVIMRDGNTLNLVHMHRPKLGTSLASVIGYVKTLRTDGKSSKRSISTIQSMGNILFKTLEKRG